MINSFTFLARSGGLILLLAVAVMSQVFAQQLISGKVIDPEGQPLEGVTVRIKEQSVRTITDKKGVYTLTIGGTPGQVVVFSFVGFAEKEINVEAGRSTYDIRLDKLETQLDDVLVVGYGTVRRADLTGSVGSVRMEDLTKAPVASFEDALAGRVAGVSVAAVDGQPGSLNNIVIRGGNSITQSNSPLFVIDGFPIEDPDNNVLNPEDIESIEVLKDASSTAIYGTRGANGVIMITTKKGKAGRGVVTYNGWYGLQKNIKRQEVMSPYEFVKYQFELNSTAATNGYLNDGKTVESYRGMDGVDWQGLVLQTAPMQNHSLSLRGGNDNTKYALSGSVLDQEGIIVNNGFSRYQGRVVLDQTINSRLKAGINVNYSHTDTYGKVARNGFSNSGNASSYYMFSLWGYRPVTGRDANDESFVEDPFDPDITGTADLRVNPLQAVRNAYNKSFNHSIITNGYVTYNFLKDFTLRINGGYTRSAVKGEVFNNSKTAAGNPLTVWGTSMGVHGSVSNTEINSWLNENILTYNKRFKGEHTLDVVSGFTLQGNSRNANGFTSTHVPNEVLSIAGLAEGILTESSTSASESKLASFLGRVNYGFKSRYLLTLSFRRDGSSKFAPENRWGNFPSGAFAWRIINEPFMKQIPAVSDAKLRVSYGLTGNNRVSDFAYLSTLRQNIASNSGNTFSSYFFNNTFHPGTVPTAVGNSQLVWERTDQLDMGMDLGLFKNRLNLTVDYYRKRTRDLLLNANLPTSTGYLRAFKNVGAVANNGLELTLNTIAVQSTRFSWSPSFNIAFNRNKVLGLNSGQTELRTLVAFNSAYNNSQPYIAISGQPVAQFFGFVFDGLYQLSDFDVAENGAYVLKDDVPTNGMLRTQIQPGYMKYKDLDGNGEVNENDLTTLGNPLPKHIGGFSNNFTYRGFDLNIFFQWSYGNKVLNANRTIFEGSEARYSLNMFKSMENRWSPDNQASAVPVAGGYGPAVYSDRIIEDGSFLRLKTVSFGYNLPASLLKRINIANIRMHVSAQNLITWTNYSGVDPEVSVRHSALTPGFDWSAYPIARTITFGLNTTF